MAKILFLQNFDYELLGPMYLSSALKQKGHECRMAIGETLKDFAPIIEREKPDLVGFSLMSAFYQWAADIGLEIKRQYGIPTIAGGAHPTFFPNYIENEGIDMIARGECEEAIVEIVEAVEEKRPFDEIQNLSFKRCDGRVVHNAIRNLTQNIDSFPFPDRHLYDGIEKRLDRTIRTVITSRGCPFDCTFCFVGALRKIYEGKGKFVRLRGIDNVIEECRTLKNEINDLREIYFNDDLFGANKKWLYDFLPRYKKEIGLGFICMVRADIVASDEEYAPRLAEGGCKTAYFGLESGNEMIRNQIIRKELSNDAVIKAAGMLHKAGIKFRTFNIMGLPNESFENALETVELNVKIKTDYPWCSLFMPLPGTELTEYAIMHGCLDESYRSIDSIQRSYYIPSKLKTPDMERIINLQRFFQTVVLWPWTLPVVKKLVHFKNNVFFTLWFGLVYFYVYLKSESRSFWATLKFFARNFQHQFEKKRAVKAT